MSQLLDEALALEEDERCRWLERATQEYPDLAAGLRAALLPGAAQAADLKVQMSLRKLGSTADETNAPAASDLKHGARVGPYELIRLLGAGGMAEVWLAGRADGAFKREVALKLPMRARLDTGLEARFPRERDILASLEHPHIARFYDAGVGAEGLPYLSMEYVEGEPLTDWCDARRLGIPERLALFLQVLEAVQYAHEKHVIHRDLKPSNILVTQSGQVRLVDFGVARLLEADRTDQTALTSVYGRALTPDYASPELLRGDLIDARSDLYSLGVLLYEVLSGGRPYRLKSAASIGLLDQAIETVEVKKPSQQIDPAAANSRACTADRLAGQLRGDLDAIVLKALAKEPAQRYPSAAALAEDLHRHLDGKPIGARPARVVYRLRKFVLRNRAPLGVAVAALAAILAAVGYGLYRESRAQVSVSARALVMPVAPSPASAVAVFAPPAHSIAVLPFTDLSEKHDQEYFADGIAEEIIDRLVKVPELRVPARASSFYFKGRPTKVSEIARDLSVANVLEGSVRTSANRLRVTVQLVRADTGYQVWSESYDRQLQDVFKVQDEIATAVAGALQVSLMGGPLTQEIGGTHSFKAYQLYLQARRDLFDFTATSLKHGEAVLQQAVTIDPHFGLAWSLMALISANEADISVVSRPKGYGGGLRLAMHAIKVSPGLAAPHATLAYVYTIYDWDWPAAAEEVHRALDINPRDEWALESAGVLARTLGHWDEAVSYHRALVAQDPLSTIGYLDLGNTLYLAGRYPESEAAYRRGLDIDPNVSVLKKFFAKTLLAEGKPAAALETLESIEPGPFKLQYLPAVLLANGRKADADAVLQELISKYPDSFTYSIAMNLAYRNEKDLSLQWLERAYALKDDALIELVGEPLYRNLAADQRFKAFLRKMNLPD